VEVSRHSEREINYYWQKEENGMKRGKTGGEDKQGLSFINSNLNHFVLLLEFRL